MWGRNTDGQVVMVPHCSGDIKRRTLKSIFESLQISPEDFIRLKRGKS
ncbi:MAG: hypothetical protein HYZ69_00795 [Candidatus Colwellbacteria bacterium]|nr:hypothetical protein [Candidatus Colwellbacteria bacterium]